MIAHRLRPALVFFVVTAAWSRAAEAQLSYAFDAGGALAQFDNAIHATGLTLSPDLDWRVGQFSLGGTGTATLMPDAQLAAQGVATGAYLKPLSSHLGLELSATGVGVTAPGATRGLAIGQARLNVIGSSAGAWIGAGLGLRTNPGGVTEANAGVWWQRGPFTVTAALTVRGYSELVSTHIDTATSPPLGDTLGGSSGPLAVASRQTTLSDMGLAVHWERGIVELDVDGSARLRSASNPGGVWGSAALGLWFTPAMAVVVRGGQDPSAPLLGLPGSRYLTAGIRVAPHRVTRLAPNAVSTPTRAPMVSLAHGSDGRYVLQLVAPSATTVTVSGDFTEWIEKPLVRMPGGVWELPESLAPGVHRLTMRIDGASPAPPPGLASVPDEFGGQVGLLVVPQP